jgi:hypothetical protein
MHLEAESMTHQRWEREWVNTRTKLYNSSKERWGSNNNNSKGSSNNKERG